MCLDTITQLLNIPGFRVVKLIKITDDEIHLRVEEKERTNFNEYHSCDVVPIEGLRLGQRRVYLHVLKRKYHNPLTRKIETQKVSWIADKGRVTRALAEQIYRLTSITTNVEAGWFLGMDDQKVYRIDKGMLEMLAEERLKPTPASKNISVDEVAWKKHHRYLTNVVDVDEKVITWNKKGRKSEVLDVYYDSFTKKQLERIESVALDGARTYISSTKNKAPEAMIIWDHFHMVQKTNKTLDQVRRDELRVARRQKDIELIEMTNCKQRFMLFKARKHLTPRQEGLLEQLCQANEPIYKGVLLKESLVSVYALESEDQAIEHLYSWIDSALGSGLRPFIELAWSVVEKIEYLLNWFSCRKSSAISEGFNNKIKRLKRMAYGYKDINYFCLKIHQHCGYLNPRRFSLN